MLFVESVVSSAYFSQMFFLLGCVYMVRGSLSEELRMALFKYLSKSLMSTYLLMGGSIIVVFKAINNQYIDSMGSLLGWMIGSILIAGVLLLLTVILSGVLKDD